MKDILPPCPEPGGPIRHDTFPLGGTDFAAEVGLARLAKLALFALGRVEGHDMVARLDVGDALANGLDDAGALVAEDDGEGALGVFA